MLHFVKINLYLGLPQKVIELFSYYMSVVLALLTRKQGKEIKCFILQMQLVAKASFKKPVQS